MFVPTQTNGSRTYLLIVDNQWVDGKVKQRRFQNCNPLEMDNFHRYGVEDELELEKRADHSSNPRPLDSVQIGGLHPTLWLVRL